MAAQNTKFAFIKKSNIQTKLSSGEIDNFDYVFATDTNELYCIDKNGEVQRVQSRIKVYSSISNANKALLEDRTIYIGEIVVVKTDEYAAYIVVLDENGKNKLLPISTTDYDSLENKPIVNLSGTVTEPIVLNELASGSYSINGQYKFKSEDVTVNMCMSKQIFYVYKNAENVVISHVTNKGINKYVITENDVSLENYITDKDIESMIADKQAIIDLF